MANAYESVFDAAGVLQVPLAEMEYTIDPDLHCDVPELAPAIETQWEDFNVYVYRPWDATTNWPSEAEYPVIFFSPGAALRVVAPLGADLALAENHYYSHLFEPLTRDGHIVVAVEPPNFQSDSEMRRKLMLCSMIWARDHWAESARMSDSAVVMGHSRGGSAAMTIIDTLFDTDDDGEIDDLTPGTAVDDYEICAAVPIAPRWGPDEGSSDSKTDIDIDNPNAPPMLAIVGASDNDTTIGTNSVFDQRVPEDLISQ